jgi:hypothetical protein
MAQLRLDVLRVGAVGDQQAGSPDHPRTTQCQPR